MKNQVYITLIALLCTITSIATAEIPKIGILYNEITTDTTILNDNLKTIRELFNSRPFEVVIKGYGKTQEADVAFKAMLFHKPENLKVLIGPSDYLAMKKIDKFIGTQNEKMLKHPYFFCPALDTPASEFSNIKFLTTGTTIQKGLKTYYSELNKRKVEMISKDLIEEYDMNEIAVYYENSRSGLEIFKQFDQFDPQLRVTGKAFPDSQHGEYAYPSVSKFVNNIADKDIRMVILAPEKRKMVRVFLEYLRNYNQKQLASYRPTLVFFKSYELDTADFNLLRKLEVFEISTSDTIVENVCDSDMEKAIDAFHLSLEIFNNDISNPQLTYITSDSYFKHLSTLKMKDKKFLSRQFNLPITDFSGANVGIELHTLKYKKDEINRTEFAGFYIDKVPRFAQTHVLPFLKYQNFPRNPFILLVFVIITFISFALFMNGEYYIPYNNLFKIKSFWIWFTIYALITIATISIFLYYGYIKSTQIAVILSAGIACPLIMNYIFKRASVINVPFVSVYILDFITRMKESIDLAFRDFIPNKNFEKLINHIALKSSFTKIRMSVYSLIVGMRSNALTKKFSSDLKKIMDEVDATLTKHKLKNDKEMENIRKRELIRFYIQILFFTSKNESAFRKSLIDSGLGIASVMNKLVNPETVKASS